MRIQESYFVEMKFLTFKKKNPSNYVITVLEYFLIANIASWRCTKKAYSFVVFREQIKNNALLLC